MVAKFGVGCGALLLAAVSAAQAASPTVARGGYIAAIAGCADCHSPMGPKGPIAGQEFAGGPLSFAPIHPAPVWADRAPRIAGIPAGYTKAELEHLLRTGKRPNGTEPRPPMPQFRLTQRDAADVVAYLASLKP